MAPSLTGYQEAKCRTVKPLWALSWVLTDFRESPVLSLASFPVAYPRLTDTRALPKK